MRRCGHLSVSVSPSRSVPPRTQAPYISYAKTMGLVKSIPLVEGATYERQRGADDARHAGRAAMETGRTREVGTVRFIRQMRMRGGFACRLRILGTGPA